MMFSGLKVQ